MEVCQDSCRSLCVCQYSAVVSQIEVEWQCEYTRINVFLDNDLIDYVAAWSVGFKDRLRLSYNWK